MVPCCRLRDLQWPNWGCMLQVAGATSASTVHKPLVQVAANFQEILFPPPSSGKTQSLTNPNLFEAIVDSGDCVSGT